MHKTPEAFASGVLFVAALCQITNIVSLGPRIVLSHSSPRACSLNF